MNFVRRLLSRVGMAPADEELGQGQSVYTPDGRRSSQYPEEAPSTVVEDSVQLRQFRLLVGRKLRPSIETHKSFTPPGVFNRHHRPAVTGGRRPAPNTGIYGRVVDNEIKCKKAFKYGSLLINSCLGLQIVVAAALTALGASNGSHATVTVFGAINTVIAGFLTYLKGSGLPNRLKFFQHEWAKIREFIEQRERDLSISGNSIDVFTEVYTIRQMFVEVRADIEANTPDRFVSVANLGRKPVTVAPGPPLAGGRETLRNISGFKDGTQQMREKASSLHKETNGVEKEIWTYGSAASSEAHQYATHAQDDIGNLKSRLQEQIAEIARLKEALAFHRGKSNASKGSEIEEMAANQVEERRNLRSDVLSREGDIADKTEHQATVKASDPAADASGRTKATLEFENRSQEEKPNS